MHTIRLIVLGVIGLTASCAEDKAKSLGQENLAARADASVVVIEPDRIEGRTHDSVAQVQVTLHQFDDAVNGLSFPDESELLAVALNHEVILIDAVSAKETSRFEPCQSCSTVHITRSDDGREILMAGRARNTGAAYETASGRKLRDLTGPDYRAAYSPDRMLLSVANRQAVIEESASERLVWESGITRVGAVGYAPDGSRFDSDSEGNGLRILKLSPDGRLIATGGGTDRWGYARVWDVETCTLRAEVNLRERVGSLSFHKAEPLLAAGSWSGEAAIIDLSSVQ